MAKKVGTLIKEARTGAGLTQEQLAKKVRGLTASDISKAERGEKDLTQEQLKTIAKVTGVTQKSLLDAAKGKTSSGSSSKKTTSSSSSKKTSSGSSSKKTSSGSSAKKTGTGSSGAVTLTAEEKKLLSLYRKADASRKEAALKALQKEDEDGSLLGTILETAIGLLSPKD